MNYEKEPIKILNPEDAHNPLIALPIRGHIGELQRSQAETQIWQDIVTERFYSLLDGFSDWCNTRGQSLPLVIDQTPLTNRRRIRTSPETKRRLKVFQGEYLDANGDLSTVTFRHSFKEKRVKIMDNDAADLSASVEYGVEDTVTIRSKAMHAYISLKNRTIELRDYKTDSNQVLHLINGIPEMVQIQHPHTGSDPVDTGHLPDILDVLYHELYILKQIG